MKKQITLKVRGPLNKWKCLKNEHTNTVFCQKIQELNLAKCVITRNYLANVNWEAIATDPNSWGA